MTQSQPLIIQYRIYISDGNTRYYLRDWIVCDKYDNLVFDAELHFAMKFRKWNTAMQYREKMVRLGYHPHIEQV